MLTTDPFIFSTDDEKGICILLNHDNQIISMN